MLVGEDPDLTLWADGGTIGGSPGAGVYWSVGSAQRGVVRYQDNSGSRRHSDEAEYLALRAALQIILQVSSAGSKVLIYMDCQPVVWHVKKQLKPRNKRVRSLYWDVQELMQRLEENEVEVTLKWVPRREVVERLGH